MTEIKKIKEIRKSKGLTHKALAEKAGINSRLLQKYESGQCDAGNMTLKLALAIADALEVDVKDLL